MTDVGGDGVLAGMKQYKFMRAFFGIVVSSVIAVFVTLLTKPEPFERQRGLVWGTIADALKHYKGSPGSESARRRATALPRQMAKELPHSKTSQLPTVHLSPAVAERLGAASGDLVYVSDRRWYLGGLRSTHALVGKVDLNDADAIVELGPQTWSIVVAPSRAKKPLVIDRLY
jgi:SSS family solute:Na+ symporter